MVIEAAVAIGSAVEANSLTLLAFGIDSLIELARPYWFGALPSSFGMDRRLPRARNEEQLELVEPCYSRLPFMSLAVRVGNCGRSKERSSLCPALLSASSPYRRCISCRGVSFVWRSRSEAAHCAPTPSRALRAVGSRSSWWLRCWRRSSSVRGGSMPLPHSASCGFLSVKAERLGAKSRAVIIVTTEACVPCGPSGQHRALWGTAVREGLLLMWWTAPAPGIEVP